MHRATLAETEMQHAVQSRALKKCGVINPKFEHLIPSEEI